MEYIIILEKWHTNLVSCNAEGFINYLSKKDRSLDHDLFYQKKSKIDGKKIQKWW